LEQSLLQRFTGVQLENTAGLDQSGFGGDDVTIFNLVSKQHGAYAQWTAGTGVFCWVWLCFEQGKKRIYTTLFA
jgi:hypothetical protein